MSTVPHKDLLLNFPRIRDPNIDPLKYHFKCLGTHSDAFRSGLSEMKLSIFESGLHKSMSFSRSVLVMVLTLDGSSEHGAHIWSESRMPIC